MLLRQIRDAAVDGSEPIANVLRKCAVLAARLDNAEFKAWVFSELNGYDKAGRSPRPHHSRTRTGESSRSIRLRLQRRRRPSTAATRKPAGLGREARHATTDRRAGTTCSEG